MNERNARNREHAESLTQDALVAATGTPRVAKSRDEGDLGLEADRIRRARRRVADHVDPRQPEEVGRLVEVSPSCTTREAFNTGDGPAKRHRRNLLLRPDRHVRRHTPIRSTGVARSFAPVLREALRVR